MASRVVVKAIERADKALARAVLIILKEIEKEARKAIESAPDKIKSFQMAGRMANFKIALDHGREAELGPGGLGECGISNTHADNIAKLLDVYDSAFRITCYPMFIKRCGITGELIKLSNW